MAFQAWMVTAGANVVMVGIYAWIATMLIHSIWQGRQLRSNPVLVATAAIFVTCTFGHGIHLVHALAPFALGHAGAGHGARAAFSDPRLLGWDALTAAVAIWYWTLRNRFAIIYQGAALCEDMQAREQQALQLHDHVVEGLTEAKLALDLGQREAGKAAIERTLAESRAIITGLIGEEGALTGFAPGDLRRGRPAGAHR